MDMKRPLLIKNAIVVAQPDRAQPFLGWVRIRGTQIEAVGVGAPVEEAIGDEAEVIDARGGILIPGLVNTHAHSHSSLTRGSAEGMTLEPWLNALIREQAQLTPEQARVGAFATYAEMLLSGTTTALDMCISPEVAREAAEAIGIRAVIAPYVADSMRFAPTLERTEAMLASTAPNARVRTWVGLHDIESVSEGLLRRGASLARQYGVGLHLHCAESEFLTRKTLTRTGRSPVEELEHLDALFPGTHLAHCVWVNESDQQRMAARGASAAHCPHANLKLGSGIAPVAAMRTAGVRVALATDGAKANNRLDMFDVMKFASLLAKGTARDASVLQAGEVLAMASTTGASMLGIDAGEIAPGRLADLTLVGVDRFHLQPAVPETVVTNLVHAARGSDVSLVIVDGRIVVREGRLTLVDQDQLLARHAAVGRKLLALGQA